MKELRAGTHINLLVPTNYMSKVSIKNMNILTPVKLTINGVILVYFLLALNTFDPFQTNVPFLYPLKHWKTSGFLTFSGGIEVKYYQKWINLIFSC